MASRRRNSGRSSRDSIRSAALGGNSKSLFNSWFAIITTLFGLTASYFGCRPNLDAYRPSPDRVNRSAGSVAAPTEFPSTNPGSFPNSVDQSLGSALNGEHVPINGSAISNQTSGLNRLQERDSILIGSFNIQTFGRAKMSRPEVVQVLVDIVRRFDILAIQELRDGQEGTIPEFLKLVNANGNRYVAEVSPRISYGQGTHSEQLVYIYDSDHIELLTAPYVASDVRQIMFRPPFVGHFRYKSRFPDTAFSFVLMNVHTSPQQTAAEFSTLEEIIFRVVQTHPEDDFILLGDLNEEPGKYLSYRWLNNQYAAIPSHWKTNTAETKNYDNLVFDFRRTSEFSGQSGVLNLKEFYQLTREQADTVSDHMPVWALFGSREATPNNFVQQPAVIR